MVRVTHFYCQWKADLDLAGDLKVTGICGGVGRERGERVFFCVLAALHSGMYSM